MELISIIIPVYNVEKYIGHCIESIVSQTYKNLEIILVDDGSPDLCPQICDEWVSKDNRIKVIHVENGGAGKARNIGIKKSRGTLLSFVDSDDYLSPFFYERMVQCMGESDLIECNYVVVNDDNYRFVDELFQSVLQYDTESAMRYHIEDRRFKQVIWNKLYKRNVVEGIDFPEGKLIDDEFWLYKILGNCKQLKSIDVALYAYRQQENSVMHRIYSLERLQAIDAKIERFNYLKDKYPQLLKNAKINLAKTCMYHGQMSLKYLKRNDKKIALEKIKCVYQELKLCQSDMVGVNLKEKIYFFLSNVSFVFTIRIRNILKIGM